MRYSLQHPHRRTGVMLTVIITLLSAAVICQADEAAEKTAKVKAAFVLNFIKLTAWPDSAFKQSTSPLVITIVGGDVTDTAVDDSLNGVRIQNRALALRRLLMPKQEIYRTPESYKQAMDVAINALDNSHVVLFSQDVSQIDQIIAQMRPHAILTIGDGREFIDTATMLDLMQDQGRIVFYANSESVQRSNLVLSSRLLRLARTK